MKVIGITMKTLWAIGEFSAREGDTGQGAIVAGHLLGILGGELGFLGKTLGKILDFHRDPTAFFGTLVVFKRFSCL